MISRERGFLLLTSHLGDPERKPLTDAQLRILSQRMQLLEPTEREGEVEASDLLQLGYSRDMADRIIKLLEDDQLLDYYLARGWSRDCCAVSRITPDYPILLRRRLGLDAPGCLWIKGDPTLLNTPAISLVGSRDLGEANARFAEAVGIQAARQGLTLISGNARGADKTAQTACLRAGGSVISIVADELEKHPLRERMLYVSEDGFGETFSAQRAISRNRCIHGMGRMVFVAQSTLRKGGTWDGTTKNLRHGWSSVACFRDGSEASFQLEQLGAWLVGMEDLTDLGSLLQTPDNFLEGGF